MKNDTCTEVDELTEDEFLDSLDIEDFVFVIDSQGNLKNIILHLKILKMKTLNKLLLIAFYLVSRFIIFVLLL